MKHFGDVVCAIIEQDDYFLIVQRPPGHPLELKCEFPESKVAPGESAENAIKREIFEELNAVIKIETSLSPYEHSYEHLSLNLIPFCCSIFEGSPEPLEHHANTQISQLEIALH
ncbi:MAG: NUDIX domain-containing protein [Desulfoprunum sp.]